MAETVVNPAVPSGAGLRSWVAQYSGFPGASADPAADARTLRRYVDLSAASQTGKARLFSNGEVSLDQLFDRPADLTVAEREVRSLCAQLDRFEDSLGYSGCELAYGLARWGHAAAAGNGIGAGAGTGATDSATGMRPARPRGSVPSDSAPAFALPVLLFPLVIRRGDGRHALLRISQNCQFNPALSAALEDAGIRLDPAKLMDECRYTNGTLNAMMLLDRLDPLVSGRLEDFTIVPRQIVGTWRNPVAAIARRAQAISAAEDRGRKAGATVPAGSSTVPTASSGTASTIVTPALDALAGDAQARASLLRGLGDPDEEAARDADPHTEFEVGDVSNHTRVAARYAAAGRSIVLDTRSDSTSAAQSLAIATRLAAEGRFVVYSPASGAQRRSFLRLAKARGVESLVLDASSPDAARSIDASLVAALRAQQSGNRAVRAFNRSADELVGVRSRLAKYFGTLHGPVKPWGVSAYDAIENLAKVADLPTHPANRVRLSTQTARDLKGRLDEYGQMMVRLGELGEYTLGPKDTPWYHASVFSKQEADQTLERVYRVLDTTLPAIRDQITRTVKTCGFEVPQRVTDWGRQISVLQNLRGVLDIFQPEIFERDLTPMLAATLSREERKEQGVEMSLGERHRSIREVRGLLRPGKKIKDLHSALTVVQAQAKQWRALVPAGGWPVLPDGIDEMLDTFDSLTSDLTALEVVLDSTPQGGGLSSSTFVDLDRRLRGLYADRSSLDSLPERASLEAKLVKFGLGKLLEDLSTRHIDPKAAPDELALSWWATVFEQIVRSSSMIANQDGSALAEAADTFSTVDAEHISTIGPLVTAELRKRLTDLLYARAEDANQLHALLGSDTVPSVARLYATYSQILRTAKPILVASPALLALDFPGPGPLSRTDGPSSLPGPFADAVILDACAHLPSAEVVSALSSGRVAVIVADVPLASSAAVREAARVLPVIRVPREPVSASPLLASFCADAGHRLSLLPLPYGASGHVRAVWVSAVGTPSTSNGVVSSAKGEVDAVVREVSAWATRQTENWMGLPGVSLSPGVSSSLSRLARGAGRSAAEDGISSAGQGGGRSEDTIHRGVGFDPVLARTTHERYDQVALASPQRASRSSELPLGPRGGVTATGRAAAQASARSGATRSSGDGLKRMPGSVPASGAGASSAKARGRDGGLRHLSVIALNRQNALNIRESLRQSAENDPILKASLGRVSVNSIEDAASLVPGDVLLSTGYSKTAHGRLLQQFGVVGDEGGDGILLNALMLVRGDLTIVSAFHPGDMVDELLTHEGGRLLKSLLVWAETVATPDGSGSSAAGSRVPGAHGHNRTGSNILLVDLAQRLRRRGYPAEAGYGYDRAERQGDASQGLLPLVAGRPDEGPSVAVFTDDSSFMKIQSLRLRHRIQPRRLRERGWKTIQLWSVGVFVDPESQADRVVAALPAPRPQTGKEPAKAAGAVSGTTTETASGRPAGGESSKAPAGPGAERPAARESGESKESHD